MVALGCASHPPPAHPEPPAPVAWAASVRGCLQVQGCEAACEELLDREGGDDVLRGDLAARCGRDAEALAAYERARARGNDSCALAVAVADLRARTSDEAGALALIREAPPCRRLDRWAARFTPSRDAALAARIVERGLRADPFDPVFVAAQVRLRVATGRAALAVEACARATDAEVHDACAVAALARDAQHDAEAHFRAAIGAEATAVRFLDLGRFLLRGRRDGEAAEAMRGALALAPEDYEATLGLGRALVRHCWTAARETFRAAQRIAPERPEAWLYFGAMSVTSYCGPIEEVRESIDALDRFVELAGDDPAFADRVARVTRRCRRDEPSCVPGWEQRILIVCSGGPDIPSMQWMMTRDHPEASRVEIDCRGPRAPGHR